ncbi:MAG: DUF1365 domain-containing protein [Kineosporiaceae bacterium]|nr:DUF1365 domain-containing protein [Kineosporiaceae bacterium]MBK7622336.1 DUF1365 domain-containing protein [Kineosporiaceae bacterium]MBK8074664.1 DUF1365 domain-containing protein [Kineosporiaceae bacterium]
MPALVRGTVTHHRHRPVVDGFRHGAYLWLVDLDSLPVLPWPLRPFAGFRSGDHFGDPALPIRENVLNFLRLEGIQLDQRCRVVMLSGARVLGYLFDPISVFWCYSGDGTLECVLAEVHNTYGERHVYVVRPDADGNAVVGKEFYVSPFFEVTGEYTLTFGLTAQQVATSVVLRRDGRVEFSGSFRGVPRPATPGAVVRTVFRHPVMPQRVSALIRWHGIRLWLRRLPVIPRPNHVPQKGIGS